MNLNRETRYNLLVAFLCFSAAILAYLIFKPGFLSSDSIDQYQQAITGSYHNWHPIAMAFLWSLLLKIYHGPQLMLLMQLFMFFGALYIIAISIRGVSGIMLIILLSAAPFVNNFLGYIIKDTQMAVSALLAFAIMLRVILNSKRLSIISFLACYFLVLYGILLRFDALPAFLPFFILMAYYTLENTKVSRVVLFCIISITGVSLFNTLLNYTIKPEKKYPENKLFIHDLAGIYVATGEDVFPKLLYETTPRFDTVVIREKYHPATYDDLWWNAEGNDMRVPNSIKYYKETRSAWLNGISQYPVAYLKHRFNGFLYHLRIKKRSDVFSYYHPWVTENDLGVRLPGSRLYHLYMKWMAMYKGSIFMLPWFWLLINIVLFVPVFFIGNKKIRHLTLTLLISSLFYRVPQFFVFQTDTEFRYFYWTCISCSVTVVLIVRGWVLKFTNQ